MVARVELQGWVRVKAQCRSRMVMRRATKASADDDHGGGDVGVPFYRGYSMEELWNVLKIHEEHVGLAAGDGSTARDDSSSAVRGLPDKSAGAALGGLHELVMKTLELNEQNNSQDSQRTQSHESDTN